VYILVKKSVSIVHSRKSQAAMEFLMTYGWALLVVFIAIAGLVFLGILNTEDRLPDRATLAPGLVVQAIAANESHVTFLVKNGLGRNLFDLSITAEACNGGVGASSTPVDVAQNKAELITIDCGEVGVSGDKFKSSLIVDYDTVSQGISLSHSHKGDVLVTISGGAPRAGRPCSEYLDNATCTAASCYWNASAAPPNCTDMPPPPGVLCQTLDQAGMTYTLDQDLTTSASCFIVTANGITINGLGLYSITGDGEAGDYGIELQGADSVTVIGLTIDNFRRGIYFNSADDAEIWNTTITSTTDLYVDGSSRDNQFIGGSFTTKTVEPGGEFERRWNYRAYVDSDLGQPINGATVRIYDEHYDSIGVFTTNPNGYTDIGTTIEYVDDSGTEYDTVYDDYFYVSVEHPLYVDHINHIWYFDVNGNDGNNLTANYTLISDTVLSIELVAPANHSGVVTGFLFNVVFNVSCLKGTCGDVNVSLWMDEFVDEVDFTASSSELDCFDGEDDFCLGRLGGRGWSGTSSQGPLRNPNSIAWACGTCGSETSGYQHRIDWLYRAEGCIGGMSSLPGTQTCLRIGTGANADYWNVSWTGWSQWSQGGFSYDRSQGMGAPISFTHSNGGTEEDCITSDVCITRANAGPVYNSQDFEWACGNCNESPSTWANLIQNSWSNFATNPLSCVNNMQSDVPNNDFCLHRISSDNYYDVDFDTWGQMGSGWSYTRRFTYPKGVVSTTPGTEPFYTTTTNPSFILEMVEGSSQLVTFVVNNTKDYPGEFEIFGTANSTTNPEVNDESEHVFIEPLSGGASTMTLDSPEDNYFTDVVAPVDFTCSATTNLAGATLDNVTLQVWDNTGSLVYSDTDSAASGTSYTASFLGVNLAFGEYDWNCLGDVDLGSTFSAEVNSTIGIGISPVCVSIDLVDSYENIYYGRSYDYIYNVSCLPCAYGDCGNIDLTYVISLIKESTYFSGPGLDCFDNEDDFCIGRIGGRGWNGPGYSGPLRNNNSIAWACGACGAETSGYHHRIDWLYRDAGCISGMSSLPGTQTCLKIGSGPTVEYWDVFWNSWSQWSQGGFSYDRSQGGGPITSFTHSDYGTEEDCITSDVCLTRANAGPVYNSQDMEWACGMCNESPSTWSNLIQNSWSSFATTSLSCVSSQLSTSIPNNDFCLYIPRSDNYYDFDFDTWQSTWNGQGWAYNRTFTIPRTVMSTTAWTEPFWTTSSNPTSVSLNAGDTSQVTFSVAAPQGDRFYTVALEANITAQPNLSAQNRVNITPFDGLTSDVQLLSPSHEFYDDQLGPQNVDFSCSIDALDIKDLNLTSVTLQVWDQSTNLSVYTETDSSASGKSHTANFNSISLATGLYKWNCEVANTYGAGYEAQALTNNTFGIGISDNCVEVELLDPTSDINVYRNRWFNMTANVSCLNCLAGDCNTINVSLDPVCNGGCVVLTTPGGRDFLTDTNTRSDTTNGPTAMANCEAAGGTMANFEESYAWVNWKQSNSLDLAYYSYMEQDVCTAYGCCGLDQYGWHDLYGCVCSQCSTTFSTGNGGGYVCVWREKSGLIPTAPPGPNDFFYTNKSSNPYQISLLANQDQVVNFNVNPLTDVSTISHEFFIYVNLTSDPTENYESEHHNVTVLTGGPVQVDLLSPSATDVVPGSSLPLVINFDCNATASDVDGLTLEDLTLNIWQLGGPLEATYTKSASGKSYSTTFAHIFTATGEYEWNCIASHSWGSTNRSETNHTLYIGGGYTILEDTGTGSYWNDSTYAATCLEYLNPTLPKIYAGDSGSRVYYLDPDGAGGNPRFDTYCDMTTDGGGWMFIGHLDNVGSGTGFFSSAVGTYRSDRIDDGTTYNIGALTQFSDTEMMVTLDSSNPSTANSNNKIVFYRYAVGHNSFNTGPIPCTDLETGFDYRTSITGTYISGGTTNACDTTRWYTRNPLNTLYLVLFHQNALGNYWGAGMGGPNSWYHDGWWYIR